VPQSAATAGARWPLRKRRSAPHTLTAAVRALGVVREAQGHALASNAAACEGKLDEAHGLLDERRDEAGDDPFNALGTHIATHVYVTVHEAQCWTWLGRHDKPPRR